MGSYEIDQAVIDKEEKYNGFYAVATNLDDDAKTVIGINSIMYKIEEHGSSQYRRYVLHVNL